MQLRPLSYIKKFVSLTFRSNQKQLYTKTKTLPERTGMEMREVLSFAVN